jgi:hypothetical protein
MRFLPLAARVAPGVTFCLLLAACSWHQPDPVEDLLLRLPAEAALFAYLDVPASLTVPGVLGAAENPATRLGRYSQGLRALGTGLHDLQELGAALDGAGARVVARGHFSPAGVREAFLKHGWECPGSLPAQPCVFAFSDSAGRLSAQLEAGLLQVDYAGANRPGEAGAKNQAAGHAALVKARRNEGAFLWLGLRPDLLELAMRGRPPGLADLTLFARALQKAHFVEVWVRTRPSGGLQIALEAQSGGETGAEELRETMTSLNALAAAFANYGRQEGPPSLWGRLLESVRFETSGSVVTGSWTLDERMVAELLR